MERYFTLYPNDEAKAIKHYQACAVRSLAFPRKNVSERPYLHRSIGFAHSKSLGLRFKTLFCLSNL